MSSNNQNTNLLQVMVSAFSGTHTSTTLTIVIRLPAAGTIQRNAIPRLGMMVPREAAAPGVQPPIGAAPAAPSMEIITDDLETGDMSSRRGRDVPRHSEARSYRSRSRSRRGSYSRRRSRSRRRRQRSRYSPLRNALHYETTVRSSSRSSSSSSSSESSSCSSASDEAASLAPGKKKGKDKKKNAGKKKKKKKSERESKKRKKERERKDAAASFTSPRSNSSQNSGGGTGTPL